MIVVDTSAIYALLDRNDGRHKDAINWYQGVDEDLATTPLVLAETDHLASARAGPEATRAFRRDVAAGAYLVEWWSSTAAESAELAERYEDLGLGLTDASLVALASRLETIRVATFDERHFRVVRPLSGEDAFTLLPMDT